MKAAAQKVAFDNGGAFIRETRREVEQYLTRGSTRVAVPTETTGRWPPAVSAHRAHQTGRKLSLERLAGR